MLGRVRDCTLRKGSRLRARWKRELAKPSVMTHGGQTPSDQSGVWRGPQSRTLGLSRRTVLSLKGPSWIRGPGLHFRVSLTGAFLRSGWELGEPAVGMYVSWEVFQAQEAPTMRFRREDTRHGEKAGRKTWNLMALIHRQSLMLRG